MSVLPVNTVPNIGIVLAYYWRRTGAVFFGSTGEIEVGVSLTTGIYWFTTGAVLVTIASTG